MTSRAKARRAKIQKEADFYGAMDGATKFVKGDATLGLIVTAINFVGGLILGVTMGGMELSAALSTYSIATIGDGLVSQIPSLMISTATAMVVTRTVSDGSLNDDVVRQFGSQPRAILTAGLVVALLGLIPGTPHAALLIVGAGLTAAGWFMSTRLDREKAEEEAAALAEETAEKLKECMVKLTARAGAGGKLFGAVTTKEISEGLQKQFGIDIPKQKLVLEDPIKAFGNYEVKARLGFEVVATVYVSVFEEK